MCAVRKKVLSLAACIDQCVYVHGFLEEKVGFFPGSDTAGQGFTSLTGMH